MNLLDVNVLIALAWPNHLHHAVALSWFEANVQSGWATCAVTELGFVRVSSNATIVGEPTTAAEAIRYLGSLKQRGAHRYWSDLPSLASLPLELTAAIAGHRQVTDGYLLHLAKTNEGYLITLDRGIEELAASMDAYRQVVRCVLPPR